MPLLLNQFYPRNLFHLLRKIELVLFSPQDERFYFPRVGFDVLDQAGHKELELRGDLLGPVLDRRSIQGDPETPFQEASGLRRLSRKRLDRMRLVEDDRLK